METHSRTRRARMLNHAHDAADQRSAASCHSRAVESLRRCRRAHCGSTMQRTRDPPHRAMLAAARAAAAAHAVDPRCHGSAIRCILLLLAPPRRSRRRRCARAPLLNDAADQRSAASCSRCRLRRYRCSRRRRHRARHHSRRRAHPRGEGLWCALAPSLPRTSSLTPSPSPRTLHALSRVARRCLRCRVERHC